MIAFDKLINQLHCHGSKVANLEGMLFGRSPTPKTFEGGTILLS